MNFHLLQKQKRTQTNQPSLVKTWDAQDRDPVCALLWGLSPQNELLHSCSPHTPWSELLENAGNWISMDWCVDIPTSKNLSMFACTCMPHVLSVTPLVPESLQFISLTLSWNIVNMSMLMLIWTKHKLDTSFCKVLQSTWIPKEQRKWPHKRTSAHVHPYWHLCPTTLAWGVPKPAYSGSQMG